MGSEPRPLLRLHVYVHFVVIFPFCCLFSFSFRFAGWVIHSFHLIYAFPKRMLIIFFSAFLTVQCFHVFFGRKEKKISQENLCFFLLVFFCRVFSFCSAWPSPFDKGQGWAERQHICLIIYLITRQHDALLLLPRLHLAAATVAVRARARAKGKAKAVTTTFHRSADACQGCVRILSCA